MVLSNKSSVNTWDNCAKVFLAKFFPIGKTNALRERISSLQQASNETNPEAWEQLQEYILEYPRHGMDNSLILQSFYNGATQTARDLVDISAGGTFFSLTPKRDSSSIEKMVSSQGWSDDRFQSRQWGMHTVKEMNMLTAKIDLLLKKFEGYS